MSAADRIAETILRMGDIRAQGLQRSADIQARREMNTAQIWGGAIGNIGQQISQIPVDIQKAKVLDTENQIRQNTLDQQKKFQNDLFNANEIYQYTTRPGPDGSVQFDEDKLPGMVQKMSAAGINPDVVEHFAGAYKGMNSTMSSFRDTQLKHQAEFANYMLQSASPEHPLTPATSLAAAKVAQANGLANADDINKMMAAFNQGKDPTEVFKAIANYGKASTPLKPPTNESELAYRAAQGDPVAIAAMNRAHPEKPAEPPKGFTNETELRQDAATQGTSEETPTAWRSVETLRQMAADKEKPAANEPTVTIRTVDKNGRPVERVMTRSQALAEGQFPSQPRAAQGGGAAGAPSEYDNIKTAIAGMKDGTLPPQMPGRASKDYTAIMAEAKRQGFDLSGAVTDWTATQAHIKTLNGAQQTRLNQAIGALPDLLDSVDELSKKWDNGRFPVLNRANLALAKNGAFGKEAASLANQLTTQIADVVGDLGTVYMGGNSPSDHGIELAKTALSADWDRKVLHDMVGLAKKNVQIRQNSIRNVGVQGASEGNVYAPKTDAAVPQSSGGVSVTAPNGKVYTFPTAADAAAFKARAGIK